MRKKRNYSYAMKSAETHRTQLYCLPGNSYIIPDTVILPARKQLYYTGNSYIALNKLLY